MVVEQEYADLYPLTAENLSSYLEDIDCGDCGFSSCIAFAEALVSRDARADQCTELGPKMVATMNALVTFQPRTIPYNVMMESLTPGVYPVGNPGSPLRC